jgi:hypothetical protein
LTGPALLRRPAAWVIIIRLTVRIIASTFDRFKGILPFGAKTANLPGGSSG